MDRITDFIQNAIGLAPDVQSKILTSLITILILWLVRTLLVRLVWARTEDPRARYLWLKTLTYVAFILGIILVAPVWLRGLRRFETYLGLLSAGLAIAMKDPLTNVAGWLFVIIRRPFTVGDRIQIGNQAGDVIDIRVFQFTLLEIRNWVDADQSTGRIVHVPNGKVFTETLANYTKGFQFIWNEVAVLVTFESNWQKAKDILLRIGKQHAEHLSRPAQKRLREVSKRFMIFYTTLTPIVYTSVKNCGVLLTIRYLCEPRRRRNSEQAVWEDILSEFAKCSDIDFAYPTQRFYDNVAEGKSGTKSSSRRENATGNETEGD